MRALRTTAVGVVAGAILLAGVQPALAGTNARLRTADANPGGEGYFFHKGNRIVACDIQKDGWKVVAVAEPPRGVASGAFDTFNRDSGGPGGCAELRLTDVRNGTKLRFSVFLQRGTKERFHREMTVRA